MISTSGRVHLAGEYAYAGRDWVCRKVASILGAEHSRGDPQHTTTSRGRENHGGKDPWVVRKARRRHSREQKGFVGGSMGDTSVIIEGVE